MPRDDLLVVFSLNAVTSLLGSTMMFCYSIFVMIVGCASSKASGGNANDPLRDSRAKLSHPSPSPSKNLLHSKGQPKTLSAPSFPEPADPQYILQQPSPSALSDENCEEEPGTQACPAGKSKVQMVSKAGSQQDLKKTQIVTLHPGALKKAATKEQLNKLKAKVAEPKSGEGALKNATETGPEAKRRFTKE